MGVVDPATLAISASVLAGVVTALADIAKRALRRDEKKERVRLRAEVLGQADEDSELSDLDVGAWSASLSRILADTFNAKGSGEDSRAAEEVIGTAEQVISFKAAELVDSPKHVAQKDRNAKFAVLLVDYYAYGLTQARMSFAVSLACSLLGGLVLIAGVALAIFNSDTNGHVYAGVVTSVAGVLTTSIGVLFHQQASRALKHMEEQTNKLRQDMKAEQDAAVAIGLLDEVSDEDLKGRLQAALILRFSGAKLPDLGNLTPKVTRGELNGGRRVKHAVDHAEVSQNGTEDGAP